MTKPTRRPVHCPRCASERGVAIPAKCPHLQRCPCCEQLVPVLVPMVGRTVCPACAGLSREP